MLARKILICSALFATGYFTSFGQTLLLNRAVFPDDEKLPTPFAKRRFEISVEQSENVTDYKVCRTDECKTIADEFLSSMNKTVDPCINFYDFVCGGWNPEDVIPPSTPSWSRFMMFQKVVNHRVKDILETKLDPSDLLPVKQAKKWYRSCMDTETLEERGIKPIESILLREGGWPIAMDEEEWDADEHTWQEVANSYVRLTGSHVFYDVLVGPAVTDAEYSELVIKPQDLPLKEHMPLKYRNYSGNDYEEYKNFVAGVAQMFIEGNRAVVSKEKLLKDAEDIVEFEKNIYELMEKGPSEDTTVGEFTKWYRENMTEANVDPKKIVDWQSWIQNLFNIVNFKVDPSGDLYFPNLGYITGLGMLLGRTPIRTIVNYIHWHFVANMLSYTTEDARNLLYMLLMEEYGIKERPPRWSECVDDMKMTHAVAYVFVNKYFPKQTDTAVTKMTENIQRAMNEQIDQSPWLNEESKTLAKDKLNSMKIFIGFPEWYKNEKSITKFYKGLTIGNEYFDNILSYMKYEKKQSLKSYSWSPEREEEREPWFIDPITVNALYGAFANILNIPAADLQSPLFTPKIPDNVNYGIAGVIIGHEIGHGFDDKGIEYGKDGDKTELSESMLKSYYQRAECFIDQFDEYYGERKASRTMGTTEPSKSKQTRGENMADSTGIQAVFEAYKRLKKPEGSVRLEGFEEFTDDQFFFVSFAATWCEISTPKYVEKEKKSKDPHSPAKLRVIGAVSNTKGFAEAFNCPAGSPMNPANKCSVWGKSENNFNMKPAWMRRRPNRWGGQWRG